MAVLARYPSALVGNSIASVASASSFKVAVFFQEQRPTALNSSPSFTFS